jgi:hypothetical protein
VLFYNLAAGAWQATEHRGGWRHHAGVKENISSNIWRHYSENLRHVALHLFSSAAAGALVGILVATRWRVGGRRRGDSMVRWHLRNLAKHGCSSAEDAANAGVRPHVGGAYYRHIACFVRRRTGVNLDSSNDLA